MTYPEAIDFLYSLRLFGTKLGLENSFKLASLAGDPHLGLRFIHVAGTNGKGSTCAMIESIYRCAGLKVGLFTSPHLVSFTERIQIDRVPISEADVALLTDQFWHLVEGDNAARGQPAEPAEWTFRPTFFEFVTVMALVYFRRQNCDLVIWETGLGGRLDATNIVTPLASVITNIQFDHQQWLGNTLAEIAAEKAGIIKPGVPVITGTDSSEALQVIRAKSRELGAPLTWVSQPEAELQVSLAGAHQRMNAAVALVTVQALQQVIPVPDDAIRRGLATVRWPGRFQELRHPSGALFILDGAHNPDGARVLRDALEERFPGEKLCFIVGVLKDKPWRDLLQVLLPLASDIHFVAVRNERSADPCVLEEFVRDVNSSIHTRVATTLAQAIIEAIYHHRKIVISGSLHFIGEAMQELGISPEVTAKELALNEWDASKSR